MHTRYTHPCQRTNYPVAKRLNGRWIIREVYKRDRVYYINVRDDWAGKVYRRSTGLTNKKRAEQFVLDWVADREAREKQEAGGRVTFETAFEEYLGDLNVRAVTMAGYRRDFQKVYEPFFGGLALDEVTRRGVKDFLKSRKGSSARTRQKHVTALRSFFRWAIDESYLRENPADGVKVERGDRRKGAALSVEEARGLLRAAREGEVREFKDRRRKEGWEQTFEPPSHLYLAIAIFLLTGLRRRNVLGMRWRHVDLPNRRISFRADEMKGKADHEVPINSQLLPLLESLRDGQDPDDLVVGTELHSITTSFKSAASRAGLPEGLRLHDLRHSWASWLARKCSYPCLRDLLGHSPGNMVTLHYSHVSWEEKVEAVETLPNLLSELAPALR